MGEHTGVFKSVTFADALAKALAEIDNRGEEISLKVMAEISAKVELKEIENKS